MEGINSCLSFNPVLLPLHLVSDLILFLSYLAVAGAILYYLAKKKPEFRGYGYALAGFIAWYGFLHLGSVLSLWYPILLVTGIMKAVTAVVMMVCAIAIFPLMPQILQSLTPREQQYRLNEALATNQHLKEQIRVQTIEGKSMVQELSNRVRNILSIVHGIAKETTRSSTDVESYLNKFNSRLAGLTNCNDLLISNDWKGVPLKEALHAQLEVFNPELNNKVIMEGPEIFMNPAAAQHISMAFHELAANTTAHDTNLDKCVVSWYQMQDENNPNNDTLKLIWTEMRPVGQEANLPVNKRGFGQVVLDFLVPTSLNALSALQFKRDGMQYELDVPMSSLC